MREGFKKVQKEHKAVVFFDEESYGFLFESTVKAREAFKFVDENVKMDDIAISERKFNILYNKNLSKDKKYIYVFIGADYDVEAFDTLEEVKTGHKEIHDSAAHEKFIKGKITDATEVTDEEIEAQINASKTQEELDAVCRKNIVACTTKENLKSLVATKSAELVESTGRV